LTGSIGVLAGKLVVSDLFRKLGMSTDSAQIGANAAMYSSTSDFSARAHSRLEAFLDETYRGFKDHVATGRHMTQDEVEEVAKGRVWSGEDAKTRRLVDELGGSAVALRLAKEAAKLAPDAAVKLTVFPREKEPFEIILDRLIGKERDGDDGTASSGSIERSLRAAQPLLQRLETLLDNSGVLTMPTIGPVR
jgi:protease IV